MPQEVTPWEPSVAEQLTGLILGVSLVKRHRDTGPDRPDQVYWMAWKGGGANRVGRAVDSSEDLVEFYAQ